jgi:hypothetical protein
MNVIRHDNPSVQSIPFTIEMQQGGLDQCGNTLIPKATIPISLVQIMLDASTQRNIGIKLFRLCKLQAPILHY